MVGGLFVALRASGGTCKDPLWHMMMLSINALFSISTLININVHRRDLVRVGMLISSGKCNGFCWYMVSYL